MLLIFLGAVLTIYVSTDFLFTTIGATPRRFVTHRLAGAAFALFRRLPSGALRHASVGPVIMSLVALWWVIGICLGWGMIFAGFSDGVRLSATGQPSISRARCRMRGTCSRRLAAASPRPPACPMPCWGWPARSMAWWC